VLRKVGAYNKMLECFCAEGKVSQAEEIVRTMKANNMALNAASYVPLLRLYRKVNDVKQLRALVSEAQRSGVHIEGDIRGAALRKIEQDWAALKADLTRVIETNNVEGVRSALKVFRKHGHVVPLDLTNALLSMLARAEDYKLIEFIFKEFMLHHYFQFDTDSFNLVLVALLKSERKHKVDEVVQLMAAKNTPANDYTQTILKRLEQLPQVQ